MCNYLSVYVNPTLQVQTVAPLIKKVDATWHCMKADTGASKHFITPYDKKYTVNPTKIKNGPIAALPNFQKILPSHQTSLPFETLSPQAKEGLIYPDINNSSVLLIGQLCDDNCIALFHKHFVKRVHINPIHVCSSV